MKVKDLRFINRNRESYCQKFLSLVFCKTCIPKNNFFISTLCECLLGLVHRLVGRSGGTSPRSMQLSRPPILFCIATAVLRKDRSILITITFVVNALGGPNFLTPIFYYVCTSYKWHIFMWFAYDDQILHQG